MCQKFSFARIYMKYNVDIIWINFAHHIHLRVAYWYIFILLFHDIFFFLFWQFGIQDLWYSSRWRGNFYSKYRASMKRIPSFIPQPFHFQNAIGWTISFADLSAPKFYEISRFRRLRLLEGKYTTNLTHFCWDIFFLDLSFELNLKLVCLLICISANFFICFKGSPRTQDLFKLADLSTDIR